MGGGRRSVASKATNAGKQSVESENKKTFDGCPSSSIKHMPIPDVPRLSMFWFELGMAGFSLVSLAMHYLNLYRTAFWLPHTNNSYAINFHLIDLKLVIFILINISRRLLWCIIKWMVTSLLPIAQWKTGIEVSRIVFILSLLSAQAYFLSTMESSIFQKLTLIYPIALYLVLFKLDAASYLEVIPPYDGNAKDDARNIRTKVSIRGLAVNLLAHNCLNSQEGIRTEADLLSRHCFRRFTRVCYHALVLVYLTTLVPCMHMPNALHVDITWLGLQTLSVLLTHFTWHLIYANPAHLIDIMHRCVAHLGVWTAVAELGLDKVATEWQRDAVYKKNSIVRQDSVCYRAEGVSNAAVPDSFKHAAMHKFYLAGKRPVLGLLIFTLLHCVAGFVYLTRLFEWQQVLGSGFVIGANGLAVYLLLRDYILLKNSYDRESLLNRGR